MSKNHTPSGEHTKPNSIDPNQAVAKDAPEGAPAPAKPSDPVVAPEATTEAAATEEPAAPAVFVPVAGEGQVAVDLLNRDRGLVETIVIDGPAPFRFGHNGTVYERVSTAERPQYAPS
jgi:hypothetical protein